MEIKEYFSKKTGCRMEIHENTAPENRNNKYYIVEYFYNRIEQKRIIVFQSYFRTKKEVLNYKANKGYRID